ncbi:uncharacterized protein LOC113464690 [Ceratina calcarata]|uniref:Uncharacterized protein LOC113464690 n=1 Tax=Ceratina calcarata TaxID=156304 RepID=A0AAJ7S5H0_9HYME|nr:uncharacterized protein LOC113464690 [Ceratina calcarata]
MIQRDRQVPTPIGSGPECLSLCGEQPNAVCRASVARPHTYVCSFGLALPRSHSCSDEYPALGTGNYLKCHPKNQILAEQPDMYVKFCTRVGIGKSFLTRDTVNVLG